MSIKIKRITGAIVFFLLLFYVLGVVQDLVTPNFDWTEHNRRSKKGIRSVFNEPKNSIDAVYFGTSQTFCSISPMTIYDNSGIRSYNLATTNQRVPVAYYLLKAMLHDQSPKLVVIDASGFFYTENELQSNAKYEEMVDSLPLSRYREKLGAMSEIAQLRDRSEDKKYILSSLISLIRYHSNYMLQEEDYLDLHLEDLYQRKGYVATFEFNAPTEEDYREVKALLDPNDDYASDDKSMEKLKGGLAANEPYLYEMQKLCREHGAELAFVKIPICMSTVHRGYWSYNKHNMAQALAEKMGVKFLDMCYEDIGLDWSRDTNDGGAHVNYRGAQKITARLLSWMQEEFGLSSERNEKWDSQWDYQSKVFAEEMEYLKLEIEYDLQKYLELLKKGDYIVFTTVSNGIGTHWSDENQRLFEEVTGTKLDLRAGENTAYLSISSHGELIDERNDPKSCALERKLDNGLDCTLTSEKDKHGKKGTMVIDGIPCDTAGPGVHFVVYDNKLGCVVDSICFNTHSEQVDGVQYIDYKENMRKHIIEYIHQQMKGV